jgi:phosphatidylethanolamine/phosphatidyl-N-methylethanolamine N-methyltransferase
MDKDSIITTYKRYARHYDALFGAIFDPGRRIVVDKMDIRPGERILEVGVGTGISLPYYPEEASVVGIDLSPHMLAKAEQRVVSQGLTNVELEVMDAEDMNFSDGYFDKVAAMYVASVVPHPQVMVAEMQRVCKPGGDLFILNHFSNSNRVINAFEKLLSPLAKVIGFRPAFSMDEFITESGLDVVDVTPVNAFGYWSLIHARNIPPEKRSARIPETAL